MAATGTIKEDTMQDLILKAAKQLFQQHGLAKVTMDDVARTIGRGRSSLYYYYKSKEEIFDAVMGIEIQEMLSAMGRAMDEASGTERKLRAFCLAKLEVLREKRAFFKTLDLNMDADTLSSFKKTQIVHHNLILQQEGTMLKRLLKQGMQSGELRKIAPKEMESLIYVLLSSLHGLKREMTIEQYTRKAEGVVSTFAALVMHGIKS